MLDDTVKAFINEIGDKNKIVIKRFIIGSAAISAKIVSPATIVVIGIAAIGTFVIPNYEMALAIRLIRFPMLMCVVLSAGIIKGSLLNIEPVFGNGIVNIGKSSLDSTYQYAGMEIYLLIYPYVLGNINKQKLAYKAAFITALIYTWITFVTIYSLGIDIIPKSFISVPFVAKFIEVPFLFSLLQPMFIPLVKIKCYHLQLKLDME